MITTCCEHLIFGQTQSYSEGNYYGFRQRFGQTSIKPRSLAKILQSVQRQLSTVHVLILDLKTDNGKAFFISSGTSFHDLGPKLAIVSVPKCAVCIFLVARCARQDYNFHFPEKQKPLFLFQERGHFPRYRFLQINTVSFSCGQTQIYPSAANPVNFIYFSNMQLLSKYYLSLFIYLFICL